MTIIGLHCLTAKSIFGAKIDIKVQTTNNFTLFITLFLAPCSQLLEIILSFLLRLPAKFDGVGGAVVIAGEARQAGFLVGIRLLSVVFPFRQHTFSAFDVVNGTHLSTFSASDAAVFLHVEPFIGHEFVHKERSYRPAEEPGNRTFHQ